MPPFKPPGPYAEEIRTAPPIAAVATSIAAFAGRCEKGPLDRPTLVTNVAGFEQNFGSAAWPDSHLPQSVALFFANGGSRAVILRHGGDAPLTAADYLPDGDRPPPILRALAEAEVNLLCLPPCRPADELPAGAVAAAQDWCRAHRAFLIVDPPLAWNSLTAAIAGQETLAPRSADAAVYLPRLRVTDAPTPLVPCGAIAGVYARIDASRAVWEAPAGHAADLHGIDGLARSFTDVEQGLLNPIGVNVIRRFQDDSVVWGARTRSAPGELVYVSIRRTHLMIEESVRRGLAWTAFERSDQSLWARVRQLVADFLAWLWRSGALQGATAPDAFYVRCDATTTTAADIAAGRLLCEVGVALGYPAEFTVIRIGLSTAKDSVA